MAPPPHVVTFVSRIMLNPQRFYNRRVQDFQRGHPVRERHSDYWSAFTCLENATYQKKLCGGKYPSHSYPKISTLILSGINPRGTIKHLSPAPLISALSPQIHFSRCWAQLLPQTTGSDLTLNPAALTGIKLFENPS